MVLSEAETRLAEALWARYKHEAEDVVAEVARLFSVSVEALRGPLRTALLVDARSVVALILRGRGMTFTEIGAVLNRDHSTVHALCKRIEADHDLRLLAQGLAS